MITLHTPTNGKIECLTVELSEVPLEQALYYEDLKKALWYDLLEPTLDEIKAVEHCLGVELPTREDMQEIEVSSRLYEEGGALFLTATILSNTDTDRPESAAISFVLTKSALITLRFTRPMPFQTYAARVQRSPAACNSSDAVLVGLLEAVVDRLADLLERTSAQIESLAFSIFDKRKASTSGLMQDALQQVGRYGTLISSVSESLVTLSRLLAFTSIATGHLNKESRAHLKTLTRDVRSLNEHTAFMSSKINFLLDATLGLINIDQNRIVKLFTVAAVMFMPPTLIASLYGMNFKFMPELDWRFGYPMAVGLMVLSALLPFLYFRSRKWL
jgi:magnesium transporter